MADETQQAKQQDKQQDKQARDAQDREQSQQQAKSTRREDSPKDEMVPKHRLDETLERLRNVEATLQALSQQRQQQPPQSFGSGGNADDLDDIARQMQMERNDVETWDRFFGLLLNRNAKPYVNALSTLADNYDDLKVRATIKDFGDFEQLVQQEREQAARNGRYVSREEAYHLVRSRNMEKILEQQRKRAEETQSREEQAESVSPDGQSVTTPGPSATRSDRIPSREEFAALPLEEKEAWAERFGAF